jgi:hypothetical protein
MGIFSKIWKKKEENLDFEEKEPQDMREIAYKAHDMRRINQEQKKIQQEIRNTEAMIRLEEQNLRLAEIQERLADIRGDNEEDEEEEQKGFNPENMLMTILLGQQAKNAQVMPPQTANVEVQAVAPPKFTDEQMKAGIDKLFNKQQLELLKNMEEADVLQAHRIAKGL